MLKRVYFGKEKRGKKHDKNKSNCDEQMTINQM